MEKIRIQFTLFSAFYSPLISAMSGGFLKAEGLDPEWSVSPPGVSALAALKDGSAHVVQSALSQGFATLDKGETPQAPLSVQLWPEVSEAGRNRWGSLPALLAETAWVCRNVGDFAEGVALLDRALDHDPVAHRWHPL